MTLDAGVSIYSHRVDSMHTDAFRVLGGLSRGGPPGQAQQPGAYGGWTFSSCKAGMGGSSESRDTPEQPVGLGGAASSAQGVGQ